MERKKEQVEGEIQTVIEGMTDRGKETKNNRGNDRKIDRGKTEGEI